MEQYEQTVNVNSNNFLSQYLFKTMLDISSPYETDCNLVMMASNLEMLDCNLESLDCN